MTTTAEPEPGSVLYVAEYLLATARADLARSDTKAAVLLSSTLAMPALVLSGRWSPSLPGGTWLVLLVVGGLLYAAGTGLLVWALLPRTGTARTGPGLTFYADACSVSDPLLLALAVTEASRDRVGWLVTQFVDVSRILTSKYWCLRWGVGCLTPGLVLSGLALSLHGS